MPILKARGLPWSANEEMVRNFFKDVEITKVNFTYDREGRMSGEAFVEVRSSEDVAKGEKCHNNFMGSRYIEVETISDSEFDWAQQKKSKDSVSKLEDGVLRLRGLPFGCSKEDVAQFFTGYQIIYPIREGIVTHQDAPRLADGEAFVRFINQEVAEKAHKEKHKCSLGHRYIELFKSTKGEMEKHVDGMSRQAPYHRFARGGGGGGMGYGGRFGGGRMMDMNRGGDRGDFDDPYYNNYDAQSMLNSKMYSNFLNATEHPSNGQHYHGPGGGGSWGGGGMMNMARGGGGSGMMRMRGGPMSPPHSYSGGYSMGGGGSGGGGGLSMGGGGGGYSMGGGGGGGNGGYSMGGGGGGSGGGYSMGGGGGGGYSGDGPGSGGFSMGQGGQTACKKVHMRGLPYKASERDIRNFFDPVLCVTVRILENNQGRPSGEAEVEFRNDADVDKAMQKNNEHMGERYIELYKRPVSTQSSMNSGYY